MNKLLVRVKTIDGNFMVINPEYIVEIKENTVGQTLITTLNGKLYNYDGTIFDLMEELNWDFK